MSFTGETKLGRAMIGKYDFINLITEHREQEERVDDLCKVFSEAFGEPILDWGFRMFDKLLEAYFDERGVDWIQYYLYKNPEKCYYQDEQRIPLETPDDLWKLIKDYRK